MRQPLVSTGWGWLAIGTVTILLASVVIPNLAAYPCKRQAPRAAGEIVKFEHGLARAVHDASLSNFKEFFDPEAFARETQIMMTEDSLNQYEASLRIYTWAAYAIVRSGPQAGIGLLEPPDFAAAGRALDFSKLDALRNAYLDIGFDPFGEVYNVYPGPWPDDAAPIPFRVYRDLDGSLAPDSCTVEVEFAFGSPRDGTMSTARESVGFPAIANKEFYVWSNGLNTVSDQASYASESTTGFDCYRVDAEKEMSGGGDDINNWDVSESWGRLY